MDLQALKAELTNDPLSRDYAGMDNVQASDSLNLQDRTPNRESISAGDLVASIVRSEYDTLSAAEKDYVRLVVLAQTVVLSNQVKAEFNSIFGQGTTTRTNFAALTKRPGSRADELGLGRVTPSDVADAKRIT